MGDGFIHLALGGGILLSARRQLSQLNCNKIRAGTWRSLVCGRACKLSNESTFLLS